MGADHHPGYGLRTHPTKSRRQKRYQLAFKAQQLATGGDPVGRSVAAISRLFDPIK